MSPGLLFPFRNLAVLYHLENLLDSSGNLRHLTANGSVSFSTGIIGLGASLLYTTSYLGMTDVTSYPVAGEFTCVCSAMFVNLPTASGVGILHSVAADGWHETIWGIYNNAGSYQMYAKSGGVEVFGATIIPLTVKVKHTFAMTYTDTAIKLYYDGALVGSGNGGTGDTALTYFRIGASTNSARATIDEFAVCNGVKTPQWIRRYHAWATGKL